MNKYVCLSTDPIVRGMMGFLEKRFPESFNESMAGEWVKQGVFLSEHLLQEPLHEFVLGPFHYVLENGKLSEIKQCAMSGYPEDLFRVSLHHFDDGDYNISRYMGQTFEISVDAQGLPKSIQIKDSSGNAIQEIGYVFKKYVELGIPSEVMMIDHFSEGGSPILDVVTLKFFKVGNMLVIGDRNTKPLLAMRFPEQSADTDK